MPMPPIPVQRLLVPDETLRAPDGFTLVDAPILTGLPFTVQLDADLRLVLTVPSGLALTWRDADPAAIVTRSDDSAVPRPTASVDPDLAVGDLSRPPARLLVHRATGLVAAVPLILGARRLAPDAGAPDQGARVELVVLGWDIRAGSMRGPGDFGSRLTLAWRLAHLAVAEFSTAPINPALADRLPPPARMESVPRGKWSTRIRRFGYKKVLNNDLTVALSRQTPRR